MKLDFWDVNVDAVGTTDSARFHKARIPVLTLHSVTAGDVEVDQLEKRRLGSTEMERYNDTHTSCLRLSAHLDRKLP